MMHQESKQVNKYVFKRTFNESKIKALKTKMLELLNKEEKEKDNNDKNKGENDNKEKTDPMKPCNKLYQQITKQINKNNNEKEENDVDEQNDEATKYNIGELSTQSKKMTSFNAQMAASKTELSKLRFMLRTCCVSATHYTSKQTLDQFIEKYFGMRNTKLMRKG